MSPLLLNSPPLFSSINYPVTCTLPHSNLFTPNSPPPPRPNTDPRCNTFLFTPISGSTSASFSNPPLPTSPNSFSPPRVSTPLVLDAWAFYLQDYPDRLFVSSLLHIIEFGANIGFVGPEIVRPCKDLTSALEHLQFMDDAVDKLIANSQVHGPFAAPPLESFRCSPLGSVTRKRNPVKRRLINHLSWPRDLSVNDGIPDSEASISYDMFERAIYDLIRSGPGSLLSKLDLMEAFRHVPIRPADWHHLGFSWRQQFYYCTVLTFGLRSAPYIFNLFAEALHWIIQRHIPSHLRHYLDDFLLIFSPSSSRDLCFAATDWVMALGRTLGLRFQDSKTIWPCTSLEFLGLELDSISMEARLPPDKLSFLKDLLKSWSTKRLVSLKDIQELAGFLQFSSQVIPRSRSFIRRIIDFSTKFSSPFQRLRIPSGVRSDLHWWSTFCSPWNGVRLLCKDSPTISIFTDASGTKGLGGVFGSLWFSSRIPRRFRSRDIQFKEAYAVLQAILRWGDCWQGCHIIFRVDNQAVVSWLSSGTSKSPNSMSIIRLISMLAACLDFSFSSVWVSTTDNALADAASRFQYSRLFRLSPTLEKTSSSTKSQIIGIKRTLTSLDARPSTSGTVSHPALVNPIPPVKKASSTSLLLTQPSGPPVVPSSQRPPLPSVNGSPSLPIKASNIPPLNPTSLPFVPSTLTPVSPHLPLNLPLPNEFLEVLNASMETSVSLSFPSPLVSYSA